MMKKKISGILLFCFYLLSSQTFNLQWEGSKTVDYGSKKVAYPYFTNSQWRAEQGNIFCYQPLTSSNGSRLKVTNLQWEKLSSKEWYGLDFYSLPDYESFEIIPSSSANQQTTVRLSTLKRDDNSIYRLVSFRISSESSNTSKTNLLKNNTTSTFGTTENPLKEGVFYKIKVDSSGIFKITYKFLKDHGINPSEINPKNFRIYGNGGLMLPEDNRDFRYKTLQENAIQVIGEADGVWDTGDYALFYAQGADGYNLYNRTNNRIETRITRSQHVKNIYEDAAYYFINFDKGPGKRILEVQENLPPNLITSFDQYQVIDEEKNNLMHLGRIWTGNAFNAPLSKTFKTRIALDPSTEIQYHAQVIGYNAQGTQITYDINGKNNGKSTIGTNGAEFTPVQYRGIVQGISGREVTFNFSPNISGNPNGAYYFDFAEIQYKEALIFNKSQMGFRDFDIQEGTGILYGFSIGDATDLDQVWDVSDITNSKKMRSLSANSNTFQFGYRANSQQFNNEFIAFKNAAAYEPKFLGKIKNQDLSSASNIDYLIVTSEDFTKEADRLAAYHREKNKYNVLVATDQQIYNEFSSGSKDITAIRDFVTQLNTPSGTLKYLFILGDSSYDLKNKSTGNDNIIPSYVSEQSNDYVTTYITDDYFVMTSPQVSSSLNSNLPDLPVGRLPASNQKQAKLLIDKTLAYYNALPGQSTPFGDWRLKMDYIVDDDKDTGEPFHNVINKTLVDNFETSDKPEYHISKLYLDAFPAQISAGGQRFPQVNQALSSDINNSLHFFYFGHGGINGWAQERVLTSTEIQSFRNYNGMFSRFPLVSTITCEFTLWDDPEVYSAGEQFLKLADGGAACMITSSRAIGVNYGLVFTPRLTKYLFNKNNDQFLPIGDAHLRAKKEHGPDANHLKVNLLGDPAMVLSRPKELMVFDEIKTPVDGQIRALDFVSISGHINKDDGTLDENYNGKVSVKIFDKIASKKTLNNDGDLKPILVYKEEGSPIVKASGKAVNGKFTVEFYVPKDINYELGMGRIIGYADNFESAGRDAHDVYNNQNINVGDINPEGIKDNTPPQVRLFMNNTNFANGGITNQNPILLACVTDDTGINSTGAGVGHDITIVLDGKVINTTVLNEFFVSGESNGCDNPMLKEYQKGSVSYPFVNLEPGEHQLVFKVWDINNNSTTSTLNFIVKSEADQQLKINKPLNWPNPFTDKTYIQFEHNCDDLLDVHVQIYTITGKLVKTINSTISSEPFMEGFRTPRTAIEWDGRDDFGQIVGKGTYIFKIFAQSNNQDKCKGSAMAIEKMVLLK